MPGRSRSLFAAALTSLGAALALIAPAFASAALPLGYDGAVILLGDMPLVTPALIDGLVQAWRRQGEAVAAVPTHAGRRGNPVLLARSLTPEIALLTGDGGAGQLLRAQTDVLEWPVDDPAILQDVDTAAALAALRP